MGGEKGVSRRRFIEGLAAASALAGCTGFAPEKPGIDKGDCLDDSLERDARGQRWGFTNDLGVCFNQTTPWRRISLPTKDALQLARNNNIDILNYVFYWDKIQPTPKTLFWDHPDESIWLAREMGFEVCAKVMWAPAWATGRVPWYEAWWWSNITKGVPPKIGINLPPLDTNAFKEFIGLVLERYPYITKLSVLNEAEYGAFWPPTDGQDMITKARSTIENLVLPAQEVLNELRCPVKMLGPESHSPEAFITYLMLEKKYGKLFDILTSHAGYGNNTFIENGQIVYPEDAINWLDNILKPALEQYGENRPFWITEGGVRNDLQFQGQDPLQLQAQLEKTFYQAVVARQWIRAYVRYHLLDQALAPGYGVLNSVNETPLPAGGAIASVINPENNNE